jgi:excisionase family DNA binding protein
MSESMPATAGESIGQVYLRIDEAARYLRISRRSLCYLVAEGRLRPHRPMPKRPVFSIQQLDEYMAAN